MFNILNIANEMLSLISQNLSIHDTENNNVLFIGARDLRTVTDLLRAPINLYVVPNGGDELKSELDQLAQNTAGLHLKPTSDFTMLFIDAHGDNDSGQHRGSIELGLLSSLRATILKHKSFVWLRMESPVEGAAALAVLNAMDYEGYYYTGHEEGSNQVTSIWLLGVTRAIPGLQGIGETAFQTGHPLERSRWEPELSILDADGTKFVIDSGKQ